LIQLETCIYNLTASYIKLYYKHGKNKKYMERIKDCRDQSLYVKYRSLYVKIFS
jgi:hypothetical protein